MYYKQFNGKDTNGTNNYKVAVRMTFPSANATSGDVKVETYYLGPNYNLSLNVAGYYMCHNEFWKRLDQKDIIVRTFKLDNYWLNDKDDIKAGEPVSLYTKINLDGVNQGLYKDSAPASAYFLPWLKSPAW